MLQRFWQQTTDEGAVFPAVVGKPPVSYTLEDQQRMTRAKNYFAWQSRLVTRELGRRIVEVGCGLGLPGIAALACGLRVTFTDYDATALRFAADNARANGFEEFEVYEPVTVREPPGARTPVGFG